MGPNYSLKARSRQKKDIEGSLFIERVISVKVCEMNTYLKDFDIQFSTDGKVTLNWQGGGGVPLNHPLGFFGLKFLPLD